MPFPIYNKQTEITISKTMQEIWDGLSNDLKIKLLKWWDSERSVIEIKKKYFRKPLTRAGIKQVFKVFDFITNEIIAYMSGEVVVTLAQYDEQGNEISPIIYNEVPDSVNALADMLPEMLFNTIEKRYYIQQFYNKNECESWEDFKNLFV